MHDTLDELINTKSDDKKKDKNSNQKRRLQKSFNWYFLISVLFYTDICIFIFLSTINDQQMIKKFLLTALGIFPGGI